VTGNPQSETLRDGKGNSVSRRRTRTATGSELRLSSIRGNARPADDRLGRLIACRPGWPTLGACAGFISLAVIAAYANSLSGPFIFDDRYWIIDNPTIRHLWPIGDVLFSDRAISFGARPVVALSLALNDALGGDKVWGYHAMNIAIHIATALVLFGVIRRTLRLPCFAGRFEAAAEPLALASALLWALHPLQTAAVTYVIQRAEMAVSLFYLLVIYFVIRGATTAPNRSRIAAAWYLASVAAAVLGAATKEVIVTVPVVVLLYDRAFLSGSFRAAIRERWGLYLGLLASWGVIAWVLLVTGFHSGSVGFSVSNFNWRTYLQTQPGVLLHYLRMAVWPAGLTLDYSWPVARTVDEIVPAAITVVAMLCVTCWLVVKRPKLGFLPATFFLILAPTSSFVPILDAAFDHRMYLPLAALVVAAIIGGYTFFDRRLQPSPERTLALVLKRWRLPLAALAAVLVALGAATAVRNADFRSALRIWQDTVDKRPENARAWGELGDAWKEQGNAASAIGCYERALALKPDFTEALTNLYEFLSAQGNLAQGAADLRRILAQRPDEAWPHSNLARFLMAVSQPEEAFDHFNRSVEIEPQNIELRLRLIDFLLNRGRIDEAVAQTRIVLQMHPDSADAVLASARVLIAQGRDGEALTESLRALRIRPDLAEAYLNIANIDMRQGKYARAATYFEKAVDFAPRSLEAQHNLALALDHLGKKSEAIVHFRKALEIKPTSAEAHNNLAAVLNDSGDHDGAIEHCRIAVQINPRYPEAHNNLGVFLGNRGQIDEAIVQLRRALELRPDYTEARQNLDGFLQLKKQRTPR
jgi:protein O-mannosyl-transferase